MRGDGEAFRSQRNENFSSEQSYSGREKMDQPKAQPVPINKVGDYCEGEEARLLDLDLPQPCSGACFRCRQTPPAFAERMLIQIEPPPKMERERHVVSPDCTKFAYCQPAHVVCLKLPCLCLDDWKVSAVDGRKGDMMRSVLSAPLEYEGRLNLILWCLLLPVLRFAGGVVPAASPLPEGLSSSGGAFCEFIDAGVHGTKKGILF
ncbi:hypothetical protein L7F22_049387 [Adiantum nelumboides]|nr:hypothetical protein [Adiantum nelumboides]